MSAPFAEYALTAKPDWLQVSFPAGAPAVLMAGEPLLVSRRESDGIYVKADEPLFTLGWGGTRNHSIVLREKAWVLQHLGHHAPVWVNNEPWRGRSRLLSSGDRVAPALGLVFTFTLRPDLEPLALQLAVERWDPHSDERVLLDWVMERTGRDAAYAELAARHLRLSFLGTTDQQRP